MHSVSTQRAKFLWALKGTDAVKDHQVTEATTLLGGEKEHSAYHCHTIGAKGQHSQQAVSVRNASRADHGDGDLVGDARHQHQAGYITSVCSCLVTW
jgi:hypothetical protein